MSLNFEDFDEIDRFLKQHFENITPEEFKKNLKDACPDLFDDSNQLTYDSKAMMHSTEKSLLVNDNAEYQEIDRILKELLQKSLEIILQSLVLIYLKVQSLHQ
jgi:uncharacterized protein (UPF0335 family)